jgi:hypothetical protein
MAGLTNAGTAVCGNHIVLRRINDQLRFLVASCSAS